MSERAAELELALAELETRLEGLRASYEQYFLGFDRLEPAAQRREVDRRVVTLRRTKIRNTARRHRFQMLLQRYNLYKQHWARVCRQIENGTYHRHVARAQRRFGDQGIRAAGRPALRRTAAGPEPKAQDPAGRERGRAEEDLLQLVQTDPRAALKQAVEASKRHSVPPPRMPTANDAGPRPADGTDDAARSEPACRPGLRAEKEAPPPPRRKPRPNPESRAQTPELTDARIQELHGRVMEERQRLNQSGRVSPQALARSLRETEAKLHRRYGRRGVDFRVVVVDGHVRVKPVLR